MGQAPGNGVACNALTAAAPTPTFVGFEGFDDATGQHCPVGLESLAGHDEAELVETAEGGQIGGVEPCIRAH
ncbi:hypothetical protein CHO01_28790 [Cellulomonas hominis]|uniref:Uncharacterized protein n=1 Tax=Cellulomonas hominis TaxID=156981 RepID=A0A511FEX7_9CELL|nr:hypothetical protein CHO01_28790 [Cellulomonas hominis]